MMVLFIITYVILVCFAFTSTLELATSTDIFDGKYGILLIPIFGILVLTPILNIIPLIVYLVLINKNLKQ